MANELPPVTLESIRQAQQLLGGLLAPSPVLQNAWLSNAFDCELFLKLENMQPVGSFKIRGATYRISQLSPEERRRGVIAASAGNHAQGVAWGSKKLGTTAVIVMPKAAPLMKVQNTRALGAEVILEGDNYDEAYQAALRIAAETGRVFVPAFENEAVIAGQGTLALELLEQVPSADFVIGSIGGGGMMAGVSVVYEALSPSTRVIGCQALGAPSMARSIREGKAIALPSVHTFADGIAVKEARESMRRILAPRLDRVLEADDEQIAAAVLMLLEKAKIMTEGAAAISLAVLEGIRSEIRGKKVVLLVSGGNIDVNLLARIIDRGLIRSGRRLRLNVVLPDRPGALAQLTSLIAAEGANILQTIHDRNEPYTLIDQTEVELALETRGPEHSQAVIRALESFVLRIDLRH